MKYVVIIPAHNEAKLLPGLLESLYSQSLPAQEIILVNDQSLDQTEAIMQTAEKQMQIPSTSTIVLLAITCLEQRWSTPLTLG